MSDAATADIAWQFSSMRITCLQEAVDLAKRAKDEGNTCYKNRDHERAVAYYKTGLTKLRAARFRKTPYADAGVDAVATAAKELELSLHLNTAMCHVKASRWEEAITSAGMALKIEPNSAKALLHRGRAFTNSTNRVDGLTKAKADLVKATKLAPNDKTIKAQLKLVEERMSGGATAGGAGSNAAPPPAAVGSRGGAGQDDQERMADEHMRKAMKKGKKDLLQDKRSEKESGAAGGGEGVGDKLSGMDEATLKRLMEEEAARQAHYAKLQKEEAERRGSAGGEEEEDEDTIAAKDLGYRVRDDGTKVPSWSREVNDPKSVTGAGATGGGGATSTGGGGGGGVVSAPPRKLSPSEAAAMPVAASATGGEASVTKNYNRGYKEADMTKWCARELMASVLTPLQVKLPDAEGSCRIRAVTHLAGEALMAGVQGKWDHNFDFSFTLPWEAKIGRPRVQTVEVKGKKQKMFKGIPTFKGFLRFPDVTSLTDPSDYDVELIWGGDGPKKTEEIPTGRALSLLKALLGDRETGFQAVLLQRLAAFAEKYRAIEDPRSALDALDTLPPPSSAAAPTTATPPPAPAAAPASAEAEKPKESQEGAGGGQEKEDGEEDDEGEEPTIEDVPREGAAASGPANDAASDAAKSNGAASLPGPWEWATAEELDAVPEHDPNKGGAAKDGEDGEEKDGKPDPNFDPLKTPKMLNYFEQMQKEGYAVFVGDGDDEKGDASKTEKGEGDDEGEDEEEEEEEEEGGADASAARGGALNKPKKTKGKKKGKKGKKSGGGKAKAKGKGGGSDGGGSAKDMLDYSRFETAGVDAEDDAELEGMLKSEAAELSNKLEQNDLWNAILKIAGGDGEKALEMIENPEALQEHPEIIKLFGEGGGEDEE